MNPMDLKRGIDLAVDAVVDDLKGHAASLAKARDSACRASLLESRISRRRPLPHRRHNGFVLRSRLNDKFVFPPITLISGGLRGTREREPGRVTRPVNQ